MALVSHGSIKPAKITHRLICAQVSGATTYAMGTVLRLMHSRSAEYAADAFAKSIGAGADLASALEKLEASHSKVTKRDEKTLGLASNAFAASYIDNPPERDSWLLTMERSCPITLTRMASAQIFR